MTVASIIVGQIRMLDRMAFPAWGVKTYHAKDQGVYFKTTGMFRWKGTVEIGLNGSDLYDIRFLRVRGGKIITDKHEKDVFCEDLVNTINEQVG